MTIQEDIERWRELASSPGFFADYPIRAKALAEAATKCEEQAEDIAALVRATSQHSDAREYLGKKLAAAEAQLKLADKLAEGIGVLFSEDGIWDSLAHFNATFILSEDYEEYRKSREGK